MRRFLLPGLIAAAAIALLALLTFGVSNQKPSTSIDARVARGSFPTMPDARLALPELGSNARESLASFRGKVVVLNLFASWCDPCQTEAPILAAEQKTLAAHGGTVVGVTYLDDPVHVAAFVHRYHITFPVLRDPTGQLAGALGVNGVPATFVINRSGRIQALRRYQLTGSWLHQTVSSILAGQA
ncbi:MAG: TlpA disulfide reductase family protein [Solirubrobacteraceae bacterium]